MKKPGRKQELEKLIIESLNEMEEKQIVLLVRGDKISEHDLPLYSQMYKELKSLCDRLQKGEDVSKIVRYKNMNIFERHESFFMDLFETKQFEVLFELFEYE